MKCVQKGHTRRRDESGQFHRLRVDVPFAVEFHGFARVSLRLTQLAGDVVIFQPQQPRQYAVDDSTVGQQVGVVLDQPLLHARYYIFNYNIVLCARRAAGPVQEFEPCRSEKKRKKDRKQKK